MAAQQKSGGNNSLRFFKWSGRRDSNSRPHVPKTCALTKLRYAPLLPATLIFYMFLRFQSIPQQQIMLKDIRLNRFSVNLKHCSNIF